jgi:outer membrane protein TolC
MWMKTLHLSVALTMLLAIPPVRAQETAPEPEVDDAVPTAAPAGQAQQAQQATPDATTIHDSPVLELTMGLAIEMALENNLDVVIARLGYQAQGEFVGQAKGAYNPLFVANFNNLSSRTEGTSQLSGAQTLSNVSAAYNVSWQQELPTGGSYFIAFDNRRFNTNNTFTSVNPRYDSAASASITQPLLANRQLNSLKQRVVVAQNGERVARHDFESQVMDLVSDVELSYWDWVYSIRDLDVRHRYLGLATDLLRNNRIQVQVGTMAPIDVLEAQAEVAARESEVIVAEEAVERNADRVRLLINDPETQNFWDVEIQPIDAPQLDEVEIDLDEAVRTALARRPSLSGFRVELDTRNFNVRYTRNQMQPRVDVVGSYTVNGLGGDRILREGFGGEITSEIPGGYNDALSQLFDNEFRDWSLGLNFSYPLGNSAADAAHAQAQLDFRRQRAIVENQELLIAQQVRITARLVQSNRKRIEATRVARELSQERLEAEEKKFEVGMSTSFLIVQAQRDLATAAGNELQAVIDYNKSIVAFRRVTGTILDEQQIDVR